MSKRTGVGIIGLGMAVKPHALALKDLAGQIEFVGGFSPTAKRRSEFEKTYRLPSVDSVEALLANPQVEAVIILTPPRTHADLGIQAAMAGKHVLLEKPLDVTYAQARSIVEAVAEAKRKLGVVFQFRFREATMTLRELLRAGELGELLSVSCAVRWWRPAPGPDSAGAGRRSRATPGRRGGGRPRRGCRPLRRCVRSRRS